MKSKRLLPFITDDDLYAHVKKVIDLAKGALLDESTKFYSNSVDPFSALFDALWQGISLDEWIKQEKSRQNQKTLQNALGNFHQEILGSFIGWKSLGTGQVFDIVSQKQKIIAEVKNKYNTTKGNHKVAIYDDLKTSLKLSDYAGYTAYYVEVVPRGKAVYNKVFTPSDNRTHKRRPKNEKIRIIDGKSFYSLASGDSEALKKLYSALPKVICDILGRPYKVTATGSSFIDLFNRIY